MRGRDRSRCWFSIGNWCHGFDSFGGVAFGFLCVALGLLLYLFLLGWILGNDRDKILRDRSIKLEAICKFLQIIQLDLFIVPCFR